MPRHFPFESGRYETAMGVRALDGPAFVRDGELERYRVAKSASRATTLYHDCSTEVLQHVWSFVRSEVGKAYGLQLAEQYHTGTFESLGGQIAEDLAIVCLENDRDWVAMLDVRLPSGWPPEPQEAPQAPEPQEAPQAPQAPEGKIGRSFAQVHAPVPGMEKLNLAGASIVKMMIEKPAMERAVWGLQFDDQLDKHPARASMTPFDPASPRVVVRHERQIIVGFPRVRAALFIIRLTLHDLVTLSSTQRASLAAALESMWLRQRVYKGVADHFDRIVEHIRQS
ncbi:MAG: DUF3445 domain-containing protein [Phycisphaera sp.]|nr:DUF3445 domain-containing protein [Phycisphaera sp.]